MNGEEAGFLQNKGWDFINHTMNHTPLINKNNDELNREIHHSTQMFELAGLKINTEYFCPPEGKYDRQTYQYLMKEKYKYILTIIQDIWETNNPSAFIPRINISSQNLWYAFYKICFKYINRKNRGITEPAVLEL